MTAILINHSRADNAEMLKLKAWLEAQEHTSLVPEAGTSNGKNLEQISYQYLHQCQAVVVLLTPNWLASERCSAELAKAHECGKAIFPVKVQPCKPVGLFGDIRYIDLIADPEDGYSRLKIGLLERELDPRKVFDWDHNRSPYPGLMAFQEADAAIFFGRGKEIIKLLETLDTMRRQPSDDAERFILLLGTSGCGKSSLVGAGIIPRLKKNPAEWLLVPPFRPRAEPLDELAMALAIAFDTQGQPRDWKALLDDLYEATKDLDGAKVFLKIAQDLATVAQQPEATVLLTIDQMEELFLHTPPEAAMRFLRLLRAALETAGQKLMVIATMRSDFLDEFQNNPAFQDNDYPNHFRYRALLVDLMPRCNFQEIIQEPARYTSLKLDDALVEAMVKDANTHDALPQLAFSLYRLYEEYSSDGQLNLGQYESFGHLESAVCNEALRIITDANSSHYDLEALHTAFVPSMVVHVKGRYATRRALRNQLPFGALPLLQRFINKGLLVTGVDVQGRETIELTHNSLLRTWPQLSNWLDEDLDNLRLLESLHCSAENWSICKRFEDSLNHHNKSLKAAEELLANPRFTLSETSVEWAYLNAYKLEQKARGVGENEVLERRMLDSERLTETPSRRRRKRRKKKTTRNTVIALFAAVILSVWAGYFWLIPKYDTDQNGTGDIAFVAKEIQDKSSKPPIIGSRELTPTPTIEAKPVIPSMPVSMKSKYLKPAVGKDEAVSAPPSNKNHSSSSSKEEAYQISVSPAQIKPTIAKPRAKNRATSSAIRHPTSASHKDTPPKTWSIKKFD